MKMDAAINQITLISDPEKFVVSGRNVRSPACPEPLSMSPRRTEALMPIELMPMGQATRGGREAATRVTG